MSHDRMSFNKTHPEKQLDEVFLMNGDEEHFVEARRRWTTARKGRIAYDIFGKVLSARNVSGVPIFVRSVEVSKKDPELLMKLE